MNENPYAPPASTVTDFEPHASLERPRIVVLAVRLLWISVALTVPALIHEVVVPDSQLPNHLALVITLIAWAIGFAISYWLFTASWRGRGWARWVLAAFAALSVAGNVWMYWLAPEAFKVPWYIGACDGAQNIAHFLGVGILFAPRANTWYRAMRAERMRHA